MPSIRILAGLRAWHALLLVIANHVAAAETARDVVIGQQRTIFSSVLGEERTIFISTPGDYDRTQARYPVLLVLDGRNPFYYTSAVARVLAASQFIPDLLIVAIDNPASIRARDLTPSATDPRTREQEPDGGGAANFRSFIATELIPWLENNYRTGPYRILAGHSYGGLFAIDTLLAQPDLFNAYIATSPSLWWDAQDLVGRAEAVFDAGATPDATLFLTMGDEAGSLKGSVRKFAGVLDEKGPAGLRWHLENLPGESHGSIPLRSTHMGLEFIFADWHMRDPFDTYERYGIEGIERSFQRSRATYGEPAAALPEEIVAGIGRELLAAERIDELAGLLARYRDTVRPPPRVLERIAAAYRERGDDRRAIEFYRQALEADPLASAARQALAELDVGAR